MELINGWSLGSGFFHPTRFIRGVAVSEPRFFLELSDTPGPRFLLIHSSVDGHLSCFQLGAAVNIPDVCFGGFGVHTLGWDNRVDVIEEPTATFLSETPAGVVGGSRELPGLSL